MYSLLTTNCAQTSEGFNVLCSDLGLYAESLQGGGGGGGRSCGV